MKRLIEKAGVLVEALPYIQRFRGAIVVVKFGGSAMEERSQYDSILADVTFMECVGMLPVIVHGGGKAISRRMAEAGLKAKFVKGLRVTDEETIDVVRAVMNGEVNPEIVATLQKKGARARGFKGESVFKVVRKTEQDEKTGEVTEWGFVGEVRDVDVDAIRQCLREETIPVVTPLGTGPDGKIYNINADDAAAAMAKALEARKLAVLSDVPGLLRDRSDETSILSTLKVQEVQDLITQGVIDGGMLPKIQSGVDALRHGVKKVHIIDGRLPHSLLLEVFTDKGVGTEIVQDE
jgi:acetylglutamate kinase